MDANIPKWIGDALKRGYPVINHVYGQRQQICVAQPYPGYFQGTEQCDRNPEDSGDAFWCFHCQVIMPVSEASVVIAPPTPDQEPYTELHQTADARLGATHSLLFRNLVSAIRATDGNTEVWLDALFTLRNGFERRLASEEQWEEFCEHMYDLAQNTLLREHEEYLDSAGVGL